MIEVLYYLGGNIKIIKEDKVLELNEEETKQLISELLDFKELGE